MLPPADCQMPKCFHQSTELSSVFRALVGSALCVETDSRDKWNGFGSCQSDTHKNCSFLHLVSLQDLQGNL